jgi:hypothetical protein
MKNILCLLIAFDLNLGATRDYTCRIMSAAIPC